MTVKARALRVAGPCAIVIFGAAGDLTKRKLFPALYNLKANGLLPRELAIIGVARRPKTHEEFRAEQSKEIREFATRPVDEQLWGELRDALYYQPGEFTDDETYTKLGELLKEVEGRHGTAGNVLFYLAVPPDFFAPIVEGLGRAGLTGEDGTGWRRVIVEKPFGRDLESARELNAGSARCCTSGRSTASTITSARRPCRTSWCSASPTHSSSPSGTAATSTTCRSRWRRRWASRTAAATTTARACCATWCRTTCSSSSRWWRWSRRARFEADAIRDEKVKVLKSIRPMRPEDVLQRAVRGQYGAG